MSDICALRELGYTIEYNAKRYDVYHLGTKIGGGGREEFGGQEPFESTRWSQIHRLCAIWVAERHHARQTTGNGLGEELAGDRGRVEGGRAARIERGAGDAVRQQPSLALGAR